MRTQRYLYPFLALVRRDLGKRYAKTMFGLRWAILQPLATIAIYVFFFGYVLQRGRDALTGPTYAFFMLSGMLPYFATADGLRHACTSLREDRALLDRMDFPAEVVPAAQVVCASVAEFAGLLLLVAFSPIFGIPWSWHLLLLPLLVVLRILMTCGVAWFLSTLVLFVADLTEALSFALTALLFLTPIFYAPNALPPALRLTLFINPLHHVVEAYRSVLIEGQSPFPHVLAMAVWAILLVTGGVHFFRRTLDRGKDRF